MRGVRLWQSIFVVIAACSAPQIQGPAEPVDSLSTERSVTVRFTDEVAPDQGNVVEVVLTGFARGTQVLWETTSVSGMSSRAENLRFVVEGTKTVFRPGALPITSDYILTFLVGETRYAVVLRGIVVTITSSPSPPVTATPSEAPRPTVLPTAASPAATPVQRTATARAVTARVDPQQVRLGEPVTFSFDGIPSNAAITWSSYTSPGSVTKPALDMLSRPYTFTGALALRMEPPEFSVGTWTFRFAWAGQNYDLRVTVLPR
jgi:hypothetical protein